MSATAPPPPTSATDTPAPAADYVEAQLIAVRPSEAAAINRTPASLETTQNSKLKTQNSNLIALFTLGGLSLAGYALIWAWQDPRRTPEGVARYLWLYGGLLVLYFAASLLVLRHAAHLRGRSALLLIISVALAARLMLVFAMPTTSDDVYRYIWDGTVQANGYSPYAYPPSAPQLAPLRSLAPFYWANVNRKSAITIYPPGAEIFFADIYRIAPESLRFTKAALAGADLGSCIVLLLILKRLGQPPARALIYAWSPLPIIEAADSGHVDALMVLLTMLATLGGVIAVQNSRVSGAGGASQRPNPLLVGSYLALAALVKGIPLILLAGWLRRFGWRLALVCLLFFALIYEWYLLNTGGSASNFLSTYLGEEYYNSPLYYFLAHFPAPPFGLSDTAVRLGLLAATALATLALGLWPEHGEYDFIPRSAILISAYLLFATNAHPWYFTWLLAFVPLLLPPGGLMVFGGRSAANWRRGDYGPALGMWLWASLSFFAYSSFVARQFAVPAAVQGLELLALLGPGLLWPLVGGAISRQSRLPKEVEIRQGGQS